MVMLTEGVHEGSDGPLYYPEEELEKIPAVWNHKPVVVYHPEINGQGVSACDPDIINNRKLGVILNTTYEKKTKRLKAEAWIETDRAEKVDERVLEAIKNNQMMELSTGLFVDVEESEGDWKDENFVGIARNFRPDHLALLPDKKGACSIKDGAGFLRNEEAKGNEKTVSYQFKLRKFDLTKNEMSHASIERELYAQLHKRLSLPKDKYVWLADVFSNFFVYEHENKLFQLGYTSSEKGVKITDNAPSEVKRHVEYKTVEGAFVGNQDQQQDKTNNDMNKSQKILAILAAASAGWSEKDKPVLEAMTDEQITSIHNGVSKKETPEPGNKPPTENDAAKKKLVDEIISNTASGWKEEDRTALMAMNEQQLAKLKPSSTTTENQNRQQAKPVTVNEYLANSDVPVEVREQIEEGIEMRNREKLGLVEAITKNSTVYTKDELNNKPLGELRRLAALAGVKREAPVGGGNYAGLGFVPEPTGNAQVEALDLPVMNFEQKK
jgi:hypothetical protein